MALNEKAVKELLNHLAGSHHFYVADVRDRVQELLADLDTPQNDETEAEEAAAAAKEEQDADDAKQAEFAERVRRYNESHPPQESNAE